ncbi:uncharacterized protein [Diabrotica undecimpunctata]|uniref:uncharacterized protein n=1 Tax=Diabrotica undecimpunctata TaxID=50387 RepID=UPI003B637F3E
MNMFIVFSTAFCLFLLVKSEEYTTTAKVNKKYTIISSPYYYLHIDCMPIISINTKNAFNTDTVILTSQSYPHLVKKYVLNDTIVMNTGMICAYQSGACYDLTNLSRFQWDKKKIMSVSENNTCLKNMLEFPLFRGMVEEVSYSPLMKFLILDFNNTKRALSLVSMKNICNKWLWTTDQDNIFVFESEDNLPNVMTNFSFKDFKSLENTSQFSQEKLSTKYDEDSECNILISDTLNVIKNLIIYLILFVTVRFVFGILTNLILLVRTSESNVMELLVLSFSQNLTNQKIFFSEPETIKNVYAIAKPFEAVYESADNQYYRK